MLRERLELLADGGWVQGLGSKQVDTGTCSSYNSPSICIKIVSFADGPSCDFSRIKKSKLKCTIKRSRPPPTGMRMSGRVCASVCCMQNMKFAKVKFPTISFGKMMHAQNIYRHRFPSQSPPLQCRRYQQQRQHKKFCWMFLLQALTEFGRAECVQAHERG